MFKNKNILITGGTGSFGKACVKHLLKYHKPASIRIFSRDEFEQWRMARLFKNHHKRLLRFLIGDIRDKNRLLRATVGADVIIHAAALKQVPVCEYNPIEAIKTNIWGAINIIDAALDNDVEKIIALSTDKASQPINLYGATKLCSDKLFIQANNYRGRRKTRFSVVRYGNVLASRGSVISIFLKQAKTGILTITDKKMTRFCITPKQAVQFTLSSFTIMQGGELFIPKIPSIKIIDLARAIVPKAKIKIIGLRPGEKLHESLISKDEAINTYDIGDRYMIKPAQLTLWNDNYPKYRKKRLVPPRFSYTSFNNPDYLTLAKIKKLLQALL